ncbi:MAG TPA: M20/M25/M40 family metallo-hydrolase [Bacteroidales bacterium]|nr:M20/M25/M40 family metallo-hydrolase [Bacteroidales bacterium]
MSGVVFSVLFLTTCKKEQGPDAKESFIRDMLSEISADSLESCVTWLQGMGPRFALADNHRSVAVRIRNRFRSMGYDAELDSFFITRNFKNVQYSQWQYNVIALLRGTEYPDSVCVIGGHYDDYNGSADPFVSAPGAHDNASGTAAAIEVARVMKKKNFIPSRSIMFIAFGAEELGLYGSRDFAADPGWFSSKISFMLNNDMIAYEPDQNTGSWQVNIMDYANSVSLKNYASRISSDFTLLGTITDNTHNTQSDSYPFYLNAYKAVFFSSAKMDPYYHSSNDIVTNCNFEYSSEIVKTCCAILADYNYIE